MKQISYIPMLDLQLFAEGGAPGAAAGDGGTAQGQGVTAVAASPQKGVKNNPLANVKYGKQPEEVAPAAEVQTEQPAQVDRNAEFEKLIKGDYKEQYNARMHDTISRRMSAVNQTVDRYKALEPTLAFLGKHYGVDATDPAALQKAIEADDRFLEDEAMKKGVSVQQLREDRSKEAQTRSLENENKQLKAEKAERERQEFQARKYAEWSRQAEEAKKLYPGLDLDTEAKNPEFVKLLGAGIDVGSAYLVIHKDDIIPAVMQHTAKTVEQKLTDKILAGGARPSENGMASQSAAVTKSDVSQFTKADRAEIRRRVARGERIVL